MKGLDEEEEQLLSAWVVGRSIVTSRAVDSIVSQRRLSIVLMYAEIHRNFHHCSTGARARPPTKK